MSTTIASEDCLFCKIVAGEIPGDVVLSNGDVVAFRDVNPVAPTHVLVVPRRHAPDAAATVTDDPALAAALVSAAAEVARGEGLTDYRLVLNTGADAGQSVFHTHLHVLGGRTMAWPPG
ncbi:HIT domain-containing protein [Nocardioides sp.]|uniref:HIT domain-containing protein n=1 Tax=Nocardioides sp. TaxID=35761 RepID=UPI002ED101EB